jgi:hypothetical protein
MSGIVGTSHSKSKIVGKSLDTAKAWIQMNMATPAIKDSFGVSSLTDNGTGNFRVTFSSPLANDDYATVATTNEDQANAAIKIGGGAGSIDVETRLDGGGSYHDGSRVSVIVFGD